MSKIDEGLSQEELAAEQEATREVKEEEVRSKIIEDFGFDETKDADKIDKATAKEMESRKKLSKAIGQKIKLRDELAKGKGTTTTSTQTKTGDDASSKLSDSDQRALIRADVPEEDITEVVDYARLKGISISEALKAPIIKQILAQKAEERTTAAATSTSTTRRSNARVSDDELVSQANSGKLPESDEEIERLVGAKSRPKKK